MDLSRIRRIARARWWLVLAVAVLGAGGGLWFAGFTNENIEAQWGASAVVEFILPESEGGSASRGGASGGSPELATVVEDALPIAQEANTMLLPPNGQGTTIDAAPNAGTLTFSALAPSEEAATSIAVQLRDNYIAVDPTAIDVEGGIQTLVEESSALRARLDELAALAPVVEAVPPLSPEDDARLKVIDSQIGTVLTNVGDLEADLTFEDDPDTIAELEADLDDIRDRLTELETERDLIVPPETQQPAQDGDADSGNQEDLSYLTPQQQLEKSAAETRLFDIDAEYIALLNTDTSLAARYDLREVTTEDMTPAPIPSWLAGIAGLLLGALVGLGGSLFGSRLKGTVWVPGDMESTPLLAEVPPRGALLRRGGGARVKGIQAVRSAVLGIAHLGGPTTIGFTGLGTSDDGVSDLVLEVGNGLAGVGRSVLLVDGQIGANPVHRELMTRGSTLGDLDTQSTDDTNVALGVVSVIDKCAEIYPNLWILPGDPATTDPVDVLASKAFRELTEQAARRFDVVMVVGPSALSPFAYVMAGTVSAYIIVATVGKTRHSQVELLASQFSGSRSRLVGVVLLGAKGRRGYQPASTIGAGPGRTTGEGDDITDQGDVGLLQRLGGSLAAMGGDDDDR